LTAASSRVTTCPVNRFAATFFYFFGFFSPKHLGGCTNA
jgi:hypothetical protein